MKKYIIRKERTEEGKAYRRLVGDNGGCPFSMKVARPSPNPWSNTITTCTKDNLLLVEYE